MVGWSAFHGRRSFYFYVEDSSEVASSILKSLSPYSGYSAEIEVSHEAEWETYFDLLLTDDREYQRIQNRRLLAKLEEYGDDGEQVRPIDHWLYFKSQEGRQQFIQNILAKGFAILGQETSEEEEFPFKLQLSRSDSTTGEEIEKVVLSFGNLPWNAREKTMDGKRWW